MSGELKKNVTCHRLVQGTVWICRFCHVTPNYRRFKNVKCHAVALLHLHRKRLVVDRFVAS